MEATTRSIEPGRVIGEAFETYREPRRRRCSAAP